MLVEARPFVDGEHALVVGAHELDELLAAQAEILAHAASSSAK